MASQDSLAGTLVEDYARLGFARKLNPTTLSSFDESTQLELTTAYTADGSAEGLILSANGVHVVTLSYDDSNFNALLLVNVAGLLNL